MSEKNTVHGLAISINTVIDTLSSDLAFQTSIQNKDISDMLLVLRAFNFKATISNALLLIESFSGNTFQKNT